MSALRVHGGRIDVAACLYPDAPRPWLDLSTGINPRPWMPSAPIDVDINALPSPDALHELETVAADAFGTTPDRVVALPGSEIGLRSLGTLDLPFPHRVVVPSYGTHADVFGDADVVARSAVDGVTSGTVLLANPNNPDGYCDTPQRLLGVARRGTWLVVDEAFADAMPETSIVPHLSADDPVIVFRSFGKFFGLAGLRLGFMVAPVAHATAMRRRLGSWPVSAHAIAYGCAAYRDEAWQTDARLSIVGRAERLDTLLTQHGLHGRGACPLFRLVEHDDAPALFEGLARSGVLTRSFDHAPRWLRFGVPGYETAFDRLDRAIGRSLGRALARG